MSTFDTSTISRGTSLYRLKALLVVPLVLTQIHYRLHSTQMPEE